MHFSRILGVFLATSASLAFSGAANTLTDAEKAEGWVLLFDGKSLNGWHSKDSAVTNRSWLINDSSIYRGQDSRGHLYSPAIAESFELSVDWKLKDETGNSGVWMRMMENLSEDVRSGPEIQVCGDLPEDCKEEKRMVGASYMMYAPNPAPAAWVKPAGKWNTFRVIMNGKHVEHWANGVKIVDFEIGTADWLARQSQAADRIKNKYYGEVHYGHFVLTDHESIVWYRNIKVRPLGGTEIRSAFKGWTVPVSIAGRNAISFPRDPAGSVWGPGSTAFAGKPGTVLSLDGKRLSIRPGTASGLADGAYILEMGRGTGFRKALLAE